MDKIKNMEKLTLAHNALIIQHEELIKCAEELTIANNQLLLQHEEKDKSAVELTAANNSLEKSQKQQKEHIQGLEKMLFMISHKIRQPIANIVGLSGLLDSENDLSENTKQMIGFMKQSAQSLDALTRELSTFIQEKRTDSKNAI